MSKGSFKGHPQPPLRLQRGSPTNSHSIRGVWVSNGEAPVEHLTKEGIPASLLARWAIKDPFVSSWFAANRGRAETSSQAVIGPWVFNGKTLVEFFTPQVDAVGLFAILAA